MSFKYSRYLTGAFTLRGVGLHSGRECVVTVEPAERLILAAKLDNGEVLESPIENLNLNGTGRGSDYIFNNNIRVRTCEHVLAGLTGLGVWGAKITISGGEMPALDGCARLVSEMVMANSSTSFNSGSGTGTGPVYLASPVIVREHDAHDHDDRFVAAFPSSAAVPGLHVTCVVSYDTPVIGTQILDFDLNFNLDNGAKFCEEIASARTFAMEAEINYLRSQGLTLGGTLDNAILVGRDKVQCNGGLRWPDEFVRHKTLDLIGDLAALGRPLCAQVIAVRGGHALHLRLVERLRAIAKIK